MVLDAAGFSAIEIRPRDAMMKLGGPKQLAQAADLCVVRFSESLAPAGVQFAAAIADC